MFICPAEREQAEHQVVVTRRTDVGIRPGQCLAQGEFHAVSLLIGQPGLPLGLKVGNQRSPESERALTPGTAVANLDRFRWGTRRDSAAGHAVQPFEQQRCQRLGGITHAQPEVHANGVVAARVAIDRIADEDTRLR
ncbi:hypothetical protein D3C85_1097640 [compost metagenome]